MLSPDTDRLRDVSNCNSFFIYDLSNNKYQFSIPIILLFRSSRLFALALRRFTRLNYGELKLGVSATFLSHPNPRCVYHNTSFVQHYTHPGFTAGGVFIEERVCKR